MALDGIFPEFESDNNRAQRMAKKGNLFTNKWNYDFLQLEALQK